VVSVAACGPRGREFAKSCDSCYAAVLGRLFLAVVVPRLTQHSIPPASFNEDQLRLIRQRQVWFIPFVDKRVGGM